ncbi:MAG: hypothetical protein ABIR57_10150, partial [Aeromicrobium sp.]
RVARLASETVITVVEQLENPKDGKPGVMHGAIIIPASIATAPANHLRVALVGGALLGFIVGMSAAFVRRLNSRHHKTLDAGRS